MDRALPKVAISDELLERLQSTPWRFGFFSLMRRINANPAIDPVGTAPLPATEPFRIGQKPSLIFAPREIAEAELKNGRVHIRLFGLGMLGPNGPLPIHVTEIAREREEQRRDPTLCNFLDIFHHRSLTLLYRAWASAQSVASLDRPDHDRFSFYVSALSGHAQRRDRPRPLPAHARLSMAPHLVREGRTPDGLRHAVVHHFGVPVRIREYADHWIVLPPELHCKADGQRMSACLGGGALLGEQVPDRRYRFCIVIGPLDIGIYHRFTPRGADLLRLVQWVRAYIGLEFEWELELQIRPQCAPPAMLGDSSQLGWSGWLGESPVGEPVIGMRFEPERYMEQLMRNAAEPETTRDSK